MSTVTITIGHNDSEGAPLSADRVRSFQDDVTRLLDRCDATVFAYFPLGTGEWEGNVETCSAWIVSVANEHVWFLREHLADIARWNSQESIGCIVHDHSTFLSSYVSASEG